MPIQLNHTIVAAGDKRKSAAFLAGVLGLTVGEQYGPFLPVAMANGVTLDFWDNPTEQVTPQHYAFLVEEDEFDAIVGRLRAAGVTIYADPGRRMADRTNTWDGGRGAFFADPNGHNMEILTRAYGSGS
ncbi:VOC family protein [Embleya sp. NBC_00896]|uniref:VOC family protein n=1 Tax=Embleya sp. NBC_00896 TaxID=2975961 RepID=UPI002F90E08A|nr:VOC family protein [Embleya sp. NBC_00896]